MSMERQMTKISVQRSISRYEMSQALPGFHTSLLNNLKHELIDHLVYKIFEEGGFHSDPDLPYAVISMPVISVRNDYEAVTYIADMKYTKVGYKEVVIPIVIESVVSRRNFWGRLKYLFTGR